MKLKYKILMAIIAVSIGLCLMVFQSYALWVVKLSGQEQIVEVGCFSIDFVENSNSIVLKNSYPISDQKGMSGNAYSFTITNKCTVDSAYQVTLNTLNKNTMGDEKIKYAIYKEGEMKPTTGNLVNSAPVNTDTLNLNVPDLKTSYIIESGELKGAQEKDGIGESQTYNVYLWVDENAENEVENKKFEASINITNASTKIEPSAVDTILSLVETNPEQLAYDGTTDNNLRYIGANPNNYVSFNNELWRIIGVMNNIDNGSGTKESRLKIIRNEFYSTGMAWDTGNVNDWTTSTLQEKLNTTYLNSITSPYQEMIGNAVWNLGGSSTYKDVTTSMFYERERGTDVYSGHATTWTGQIGLMYPSDYGYATSGGNTTDRNACLTKELYNWYGYTDCIDNDWLYDSSNYQWTLTSLSASSNYVFFVYSSGFVDFSHAFTTAYAFSPALYLSSNVRISGGNGSENSPFELSL